MVDYAALRKKFPTKVAGNAAARQRKKAALDAVRREFEAKRAELGGGPPAIRRTGVYYVIVILVLLIVGSAVLALVTGRVGIGKERISKANLQANQSIDALARALGRYRFHVGRYPTDTEGLAELARIRPELKRWFGPYVKKIVPDPWGNAYVYATREEGGHPVLYSKGPDGRAGTTDDVLPEQARFDEPFRDTTWTNHWVPYNLRGVVLAPDEATRQKIREEVKQY